MTTQHLVIGGTGKTGRRVVDRLRERSLAVRVGSRSGEPPFDWQDQSSWDAVLSDVDRVYLTYHPDVAIPGTSQVIQAFSDAAAAAGVRRIVMLSGRGEEEARVCEDVVRSSGLEWTVLRSSWMNQNFDEGYLLPGVLDGVLALPAPNTPEPFTDADDIADVAVQAMITDDHVGRTYELTGPRMLTFTEVAAELSAAAGRPIEFTRIPTEALTGALAEAGEPAEVVWLIGYLFDTVLDGRNASVSDDIERVLGRKATDFSAYARAAAATGVWSPQRSES
ncbi:uncharacterized protein YbjT (DUF2867 family) [Herbihabitans rhizosphaerae]|uniref:Uncharacterized protein YbjT (DUF2867 family) n=1 Tax=Herbihabitans rhizosphaerae TaxID=1872711 RepID=A0A4V2ER81_9PSEU|nr:NAD(P)H-binding protein [Herbihabitans rhizosphaerae]RZS29531.1 uncharacterized protein YbjT (DUF2867 family) [Herbihabitans rhizosphaerae]